MEKVKNFALLLEAIKELDVALLLVGEGSQKASLQTLAQRLQIENKVHFTGFRDDVPKLLYHSDLCVISSDREGFSYVMAEALLLERPVVSTNVGDMRTLLPKACVVPVGDAQALREGIRFVMENKEETAKAFEPRFAFAKTHFTLEAMVQGVLAVYDEVVKR
jgi:glycosyltransferase involved in cell wall biosynthesis